MHTSRRNGFVYTKRILFYHAKGYHVPTIANLLQEGMQGEFHVMAWLVCTLYFQAALQVMACMYFLFPSCSAGHGLHVLSISKLLCRPWLVCTFYFQAALQVMACMYSLFPSCSAGHGLHVLSISKLLSRPWLVCTFNFSKLLCWPWLVCTFYFQVAL